MSQIVGRIVLVIALVLFAVVLFGVAPFGLTGIQTLGLAGTLAVGAILALST